MADTVKLDGNLKLPSAHSSLPKITHHLLPFFSNSSSSIPFSAYQGLRQLKKNRGTLGTFLRAMWKKIIKCQMK